MWDLPDNPASVALIEALVKAGKPVGAVCHAPVALVNVRGQDGDHLVKGKRVTGFSNTEEEAVGLTAVVPFLLEDRLKEVEKQFADKKPPVPDFWGGYRVFPERIEFWQGRENRLHDRFLYVRQSDGKWRIDRLSP